MSLFERPLRVPHTNPQLFGSALQSGNFWIRYESRIVLTLNPDILLRATKGARQLYLVVGTLLTV